ncbi:MAG: PfkB family carbohydrate kinase, partial [Ilumatobacteraceae bacterium]
SGVGGGGGAANAAATVALRGGDAVFIGAVGDDRMGRVVTGGLAELGVDVARVQRIPGRTTPISAVIIDRTGARMIVNHADADLFALADPAPAADIGEVDAVLCDCRWPAGAAATLRAARERGVPGIVDVDRPLTEGATWLFELASHLVFSREALRSTAGVFRPGPALRIVRGLTDAWVGVTLGAGGIEWLDDHGSGHLAAHDVEAVDTLGAGDVFHGAFALLLAEGGDEEHAMRFANAAAALKCTRPGGRDGIPSRTDVDQFLQSSEGAPC